MSVYRLIYVSRVARQVRFADAEEIARDAATRNGECGVTGLLVYTPSHFIQALEGGQSEVSATFARIQKDARHDEIRVLAAGVVGAAEFSAWAMVARKLRGLKSPDFQALSAEQALEILRRARAE